MPLLEFDLEPLPNPTRKLAHYFNTTPFGPKFVYPPTATSEIAENENASPWWPLQRHSEGNSESRVPR